MRLAFDAVTVRIGHSALIQDLSLGVDRGEIVGLVGPNGSGKSTALRCVYRALRPSSGAVLLDGVELNSLSLRESARIIAAVTQENGAELDFTVAEVVAMARFPHSARSGSLTPSDDELCAKAMARTDITHLAARGILSLSGGERQRALIARAFAQQPDILVLDEPTNHLDIFHQLQLLAMLRDCGLTVLVALHDLNLAAAVCDRVAVLSGGRLVECGAPSDVLSPELVFSIFGARASAVTHPQTGAHQLLYQITSQAQEGSPN